jgi:hypothetical protein
LPEQTKGQARDKAAEALGMGGRTAEKLLALVRKRTAEIPRRKAGELNQGSSLAEWTPRMVDMVLRTCAR